MQYTPRGVGTSFRVVWCLDFYDCGQKLNPYSIDVYKRQVRVRYLVGVHPYGTLDYTDELHAQVAAALDDPLCAGIGEIGLDYHCLLYTSRCV